MFINKDRIKIKGNKIENKFAVSQTQTEDYDGMMGENTFPSEENDKETSTINGKWLDFINQISTLIKNLFLIIDIQGCINKLNIAKHSKLKFIKIIDRYGGKFSTIINQH